MNQVVHPKGFSITGVMRLNAFDDLYTEPHFAVTELRKRRRNLELKKIIRSELNGSVKDVLKKFNRPRAVLFRQLATPTHEIIRFVRLAKNMGLEPLILEYHGDKFVGAGNRYKRTLGKMPIYQYTGADGRDMFRYKSTCDFNKSTGKAIHSVTCHNGEPLIAFHHRLFRSVTKLNPKTHCIDATNWFNSVGKKAGNYYEHLLRLFIRDGVLFESFIPFKEEGSFTSSVIAPSFNDVASRYGLRPLIIRLLPEIEETRLFWDSFPKKVEKFLS